jgi:hypothetical protein
MLSYWQLDFSNDNELANLKADLATARGRLDSALFKHLAMLAPVAIGGMGMFMRSSLADLSTAEIAMIAVPAAILVTSVLLSAVSLAVAPTNVVATTGRDNTPILRSREDWITALRAGVARTNWHRGFEDNVQFYGFAVAAFAFLACGAWVMLG